MWIQGIVNERGRVVKKFSNKTNASKFPCFFMSFIILYIDVSEMKGLHCLQLEDDKESLETHTQKFIRLYRLRRGDKEKGESLKERELQL